MLIIFEGGEARVKSDSACGFNVDVNGTYRSEKARPARKPASVKARMRR